MPATVVIRARPETRELLQHLAREEGTSAIETLARLVRSAAEMRLLDALAVDLASAPPRRDRAERAAWDATLEDGLDLDEDFSAWR
jgi:hypothetical protein